MNQETTEMSFLIFLFVIKKREEKIHQKGMHLNHDFYVVVGR